MQALVRYCPILYMPQTMSCRFSFRVLQTVRLTTETGSPRPPSASGDGQKEDVSETGNVDASSDGPLVDKDLEQAVIGAQERSDDADAVAPYKSDFPLKSPLLLEERRSQAIVKRNQFFTHLVAKAEGSDSKHAEDKANDEKASSDEKIADPDTGFAELGGFTTEIVTGMFDEQVLKLHPSRSFFSGQQYDPEELHPYGVSREAAPVRRSRTVREVFTAEDAKKKMDFKNLRFLNNYLSDAGLILSRRQTRLSKQLQTRLERSVKLAQALALLPVLDRRSEFKRRPRRQTERDVMT